MNCNQRRTPLVFFQNVAGFMVGRHAERGIIKDSAKMVNAVSNSTVPKFTFIIENSLGARNYAMCGKAYEPRLIFAWPSARIAVMCSGQASQTLHRIRLEQLKRNGENITTEDQNKLLDKTKDRYESEMDATYAAVRLLIDHIIDPLGAHEIISRGIKMANSNPEILKFNVGVLQT